MESFRTDNFRIRDGLPAFNLAELDKIQRETSYNHRPPVTTSINMPAPPLTSPSLYSVPPPPYSYPSSTASSVVGVPNGLISPPESRRTSDDDKELPARPRQLPSIHEALGTEQGMSISSMLTNSVTTSQPSHAVMSTSPTSVTSRYQEHIPSKAPSSFSHSQPAPSHYQPSRDPPSHYSPRMSVDSSTQRPPPINTSSYQARTASSPTTGPRPNGMFSSQSSPRYDRLPTSNPQPAHSPYHPNFQYTSQPPLVTYPVPSVPYPAWRHPPDVDRAHTAMNAAPKTSPTGAYGATIKRQLDIFDLELSLNEVCSYLPSLS